MIAHGTGLSGDRSIRLLPASTIVFKRGMVKRHVAEIMMT